LYLNLDDPTGEAGINTRLEAFLDIVEGRKYIETYIPTYG
jgi:predicted nucleotide-binding protein (sugar kinase/HSP70/actin superfamily)